MKRGIRHSLIPSSRSGIGDTAAGVDGPGVFDVARNIPDSLSSLANAGVTLMEMLVVVALIGIVTALAFPAVSSGIDSLRLRSASDSTVAFLNAGLNRAERRQQLVEIIISRAENHLVMRSEEPGFLRTLSMPDGIAITRIHPDPEGTDEPARSFVLYPGGTVPRIGVEIVNRRGVRRIVRVDPITGVPQVEAVE